MDNNLISTGNCGEYFVAAELERRGFTVAVPMSNVEKFDILAINRSTHKQIAVQVKTTKRQKKKWVLNKKCEKFFGDNIFYVFVALRGLNNPEYHIVPSQTIAETVALAHKTWLSTPGRNGVAHKDNPVRNFEDTENKYLDNWQILY